MNKNYRFDGIILNKDKTQQSYPFYNSSIGLIYYLGENKIHSDWLNSKNPKQKKQFFIP